MSNNDIKNFKYLDNLIHSEIKEIVLDTDIVLGDNEKSGYKDGIKLDLDDLAIDWNSHSIDARGVTRIFYCTGKNVTIKNIILKRGFTEEKGGAIHNNGELTITESTLTENTAQGLIGQGGAIHNNGELTITESTLNNNTTKDDGGAIYNNGELTITESTLKENTADRDGGAIHNSGELTITESTLKENTADRDGGAIYNSGELTITESTLTENTAQLDGRTIHNYGEKSFTIKGCKLDNNIPMISKNLNNNIQ